MISSVEKSGVLAGLIKKFSVIKGLLRNPEVVGSNPVTANNGGQEEK